MITKRETVIIIIVHKKLFYVELSVDKWQLASTNFLYATDQGESI